MKNKEVFVPKIDTELSTGWIDVTDEYKEQVGNFMRDYIEQENYVENGSDTNYDSLVELHIAGGLSMEESLSPAKIEAFYNNGKIEKMHILYERDNTQNADVYISGQALRDMLPDME